MSYIYSVLLVLEYMYMKPMNISKRQRGEEEDEEKKEEEEKDR